MKLLGKVNLLLILIFGISWGITEFYAYLVSDAKCAGYRVAPGGFDDAGRNLDSRLHSGPIAAAAKPARSQHTFFSPKRCSLSPQSASSSIYSRASTAITLTGSFANPTNPADHAVDWEADIISTFRNLPRHGLHCRRTRYAFRQHRAVARPMRAEADCLDCHG